MVRLRDDKPEERRQYYVRLPIASYQKLRSLAGREPSKTKAKSVPFLFRFHFELREKLERLAMAATIENGGKPVAMQQIMVRLIDEAPEDLEATDMIDVGRKLVEGVEEPSDGSDAKPRSPKPRRRASQR